MPYERRCDFRASRRKKQVSLDRFMLKRPASKSEETVPERQESDMVKKMMNK